MTEYKLDKFCEQNPYCGCRCLKCPAMAEYHRSQLGFDEDCDDEEDW